MKKTITNVLILIAFALVLLSSCASTFDQAGMALAQGDYSTAIAKSLESIAKGKDISEAETMLKDAWQSANTEWNTQITTFEKATTPEEVAKAVPVYNKLIALHKMVAAAGRSDLNPSADTIQKRANQTNLLIANLYFDQALATLELGGRENAKKAVLQFTIVKKMNPEYYGIDYFIEKATKQATIKVFVFPGPDSNYSFNTMMMIPAVEKLLDDLDFVEVRVPPQHYISSIGDDHDAKNFARGHGADLMVHFELATSMKLTAHEDIRPINSRVQVASDWQVGKSYMLASGTSEVKYIVVDLKTETNIDEGTFTVKDSTDFDFSVSTILHSGKKDRIEFTDMTSEKVIKINTLTQDNYNYYLGDQLKSFEKVTMPYGGFDSGMQTAIRATSGPLDFSKYKSPAELVKKDDLNGHTFFLFDAIKYVSGTFNGKDDIRYKLMYRGDGFGEGSDASLKAAKFESQTYTDLMSWMKKTAANADDVAIATMLGNFYTETIPRKVVEKVSSALK